LLYSDCTLPTVLAYAERPIDTMRELLSRLLSLLPRRFYAHLSHGTVDVLADDYHSQSHGAYHKMALSNFAALDACDGSAAVRLSPVDVEELQAFYGTSYPGNFFMPRMLEMGYYFGIRRGGTLASVAGVHVYSPLYKVAALGNIAARPDHRGLGLATAVTARLCQELRRSGIEYIGLNVNAD